MTESTMTADELLLKSPPESFTARRDERSREFDVLEEFARRGFLVISSEMTAEAERFVAEALLERKGFRFYDDPYEAGCDAYEISMEALEEARFAMAAMVKFFRTQSPKVETVRPTGLGIY